MNRRSFLALVERSMAALVVLPPLEQLFVATAIDPELDGWTWDALARELREAYPAGALAAALDHESPFYRALRKRSP